MESCQSKLHCHHSKRCIYSWFTLYNKFRSYIYFYPTTNQIIYMHDISICCLYYTALTLYITLHSELKIGGKSLIRRLCYIDYLWGGFAFFIFKPTMHYRDLHHFYSLMSVMINVMMCFYWAPIGLWGLMILQKPPILLFCKMFLSFLL